MIRVRGFEHFRDFAHALGEVTPGRPVSYAAVSKWLSGQRSPSERYRRRIAEVLGLRQPPTFTEADLEPGDPAGRPRRPPPGAAPIGTNVYGTTREVYTRLGSGMYPVYRAGGGLDVPLFLRPVAPEHLTQLGGSPFAVLHVGATMAGRLPESLLEGDLWWVRRAEEGPDATPGDLVAVLVRGAPPGREGGLRLRTYDVGPDGEPVVFEEPAPGARVPVAGEWTVLGVAPLGERLLRPRRLA
jgi:hypothetical protein